MNIGVTIITYNPDIKRFEECILSIVNQVDLLYVIDNKSNNYDCIKSVVYQHFSNAIIERNSSNIGIAAALNVAFRLAADDDVEWLLTLDQDSVMPANGIYMLAENISTDKIGIICPGIFDVNSGFLTDNSIENVNCCITSGSLTSVSAWEKIGYFDEAMFIDGVDFEFCYRLREYGYKIIRDHRVILKHEIGHSSTHSVFGHRFKTMNHNYIRKYHIAKNIVYFDRKTHASFFPIWTILREIKQLMLVLMFEENKIKKIQYIIKGIFDGFNMKIG